MRDAFVRRLTELAESAPDLMLITGDLGYGVFEEFAGRFPRQFLNIGVAEQNMTGVAAGMALEGHTVFTYSIGNFSTLRCLEQIRNDVCYHNASVKVVSVGAGMSYGAVGASHHATEDIGIMRTLPNLSIFSPADRWEAAEATRSLAEVPGPGYLRLDKSAAPETALPGEVFVPGKARILRHGSALTLIGTGGILGEVLAAADRLRQKGAVCRVLSMHTLKPLDAGAVVAAARETGGIVTVEEHSIHCGLGGAVAEALLDLGAAPERFLRLGLRGFSSLTGSQQYLRGAYGLDREAIASRALDLLHSSRREQVAGVA